MTIQAFELPKVFTLAQARALGFSDGQVIYRCRTGRWRRVLGEAWTWSHDPNDLQMRLLAAQLTWPDAVVSGASAALVHRFPIRDDGIVHMVAPARRRAREGMELRRGDLSAQDWTHYGPIRATTPLRTGLDCIARLPERDAMSVLAWVVSRRIITAEDAVAFAQRRFGRAGNARFRRLMPMLESAAASQAELRVHRMLRRAGIEGWEANAPIYEAGRIIASVDLVFEAVRLVIEIDGAAAHPEVGGQDFRQAAIELQGYRVVRFAARDVFNRPGWVLRRIRAEIGARVTFLANLDVEIRKERYPSA